MFRRSDKSSRDAGSSTATYEPKPDGKGRATPTRREAQAAAKQRARQPMDKKTARKVVSQGRATSNAEIRAGMKRGDEKYLPRKDQGPRRRFVRDYIDQRVSVAEFFLPALVLTIICGYSGVPTLQRFGNGLSTAAIVLVVVDSAWLRYRLHRELRTRFPEEPHKGDSVYAWLRSLQIRPLRIPKPVIKRGAPLPERYPSR